MAKDIGYLGGRELKKELGVEQHSENRKTLGVIGRVGVGTTTYTPNYTMEVRGDFKPGELIDSDDNPGTLGLYLSKDAGGIKWVQPSPTGLGAIFVTEDDQILGVSSYVGLTSEVVTLFQFPPIHPIILLLILIFHNPTLRNG